MNPKQFFILVSILVLLTLLPGTGRVVAQRDNPRPAVSEPMGTAWHTCTIADIGVHTNRIHVRCTTAPSGYTGIFWFASALDSATSAQSNRFLVLLNTAYALGKPATISFDTDSAHNPPGCQTSDCRKLLSIDLEP